MNEIIATALDLAQEIVIAERKMEAKQRRFDRVLGEAMAVRGAPLADVVALLPLVEIRHGDDMNDALAAASDLPAGVTVTLAGTGRFMLVADGSTSIGDLARVIDTLLDTDRPVTLGTQGSPSLLHVGREKDSGKFVVDGAEYGTRAYAGLDEAITSGIKHLAGSVDPATSVIASLSKIAASVPRSTLPPEANRALDILSTLGKGNG